MEYTKVSSGTLLFFEKIVRSHPLLYYIVRSLIRFTNIFEEDANGVAFLKFKDKVNIIDALNNFILLISNQYARQSTFLIFYNLVPFFLRKHQYPLCSLCHP